MNFIFLVLSQYYDYIPITFNVADLLFLDCVLQLVILYSANHFK